MLAHWNNIVGTFALLFKHWATKVDQWLYSPGVGLFKLLRTGVVGASMGVSWSFMYFCIRIPCHEGAVSY